MSEPNVVREVAAGLDNAPELSEAGYEAMHRADRKLAIDELLMIEQTLWIENKIAVAKAEKANREWVDAFTKWREASYEFQAVQLRK